MSKKNFSGQRWKLHDNVLKDKTGLWKSVDSWTFKTKDDDLVYIENTSKTKVLGATSGEFVNKQQCKKATRVQV